MPPTKKDKIDKADQLQEKVLIPVGWPSSEFIDSLAKDFRISDKAGLRKVLFDILVACDGNYDHEFKPDDLKDIVKNLQQISHVLKKRVNAIRLGKEAPDVAEKIQWLLDVCGKASSAKAKRGKPKNYEAEAVVEHIGLYWTAVLGRSFSYFIDEKTKSAEDTEAGQFVWRIVRSLNLDEGVDNAAVKFRQEHRKTKKNQTESK